MGKLSALVSNSVFLRGETRFDMVGKALPGSLHDTDERISAGLVDRLYRYGLSLLEEAGFAVKTWDCEVYTMDADLPPSERFYCVEFTNPNGGMLGVQGIMTMRGWPSLHHALSVDMARALRKEPSK